MSDSEFMGWNRFKIALVVLLACCSAAPLCFGQDERREFRRYGDTVQSVELEAALERGDDLYLDACYVVGTVEFPETVPGRVNIFYTVLESGISARRTVFHSDVVFWGDTVNGEFLMIGCKLTRLREGAFYYSTERSMATGLGFSGCVFRDHVSFRAAEIDGGCIFQEVRFDSSVSFEDAKFMGVVSFADAQFKNSVDLQGTRIDSFSFFSRCTFTNTRITSGNLQKVRFLNGVFENVTFETSMPPPANGMASMSGLATLSYNNDPTGLQAVRQDFKTNGFRRQERQLTFALKRRENEINKENGDWVTYYLNLVLFDWTCDYGMSYLRPLRYALYVGLFCFIVYGYFAIIRRRGDIMIAVQHPDPSKKPVWKSLTNHLPPTAEEQSSGLQRIISRFRRGLHFLLWAAFFSLMSAFNIGFRDFNFGRWLRLLLTKEIDIKAVGWARTVSGFQALLSVYFFALFILSYFGRPFE